jgi:cbb3-type cytochrome oxidase subunit 3
MKKMLNRSILTIGLMGVAYYLYNPKKYNRMAKNAKASATTAFEKGKNAVA